MQDRVAAYILTVTWINAGVGVIVALGAWALGLEAPVMWGGLAALVNFLPYLGPVAMMLVLAGYSLWVWPRQVSLRHASSVTGLRFDSEGWHVLRRDGSEASARFH